MKKTIVIASNNQNKIIEIKNILGDRYNLISQKEAKVFESAKEDGDTFLENAYKKAKFVSQSCNQITIADDSGLCVEALGGKPGVLSARYSGIGATDEKNNNLLLQNLKGVKDRAAHFCCAVVLYFPNGTFIEAEGKVYGEILQEKAGCNGFGYDSIFYSYDLKKSFAQAEALEKNKVSHRYMALKKLSEKL